MNEYGKKLKMRRIDLGISQGTLAHRIGCTSVTLGRMESGMSVGLSTFIKACKELQLNIELKPISSNDEN